MTQKQEMGIEARHWDSTDLIHKIVWFVHQQNWNKCFFTWKFFSYLHIKYLCGMSDGIATCTIQLNKCCVHDM